MTKRIPDQGSGNFGYEVTYKSSLVQRFWFHTPFERDRAFKKVKVGVAGWFSKAIENKTKIER